MIQNPIDGEITIEKKQIRTPNHFPPHVSIYVFLEHPEQAHFPLSQGQFVPFPPQVVQVVLSEPATFSVLALGQESQAQASDSHGQSAVLPPHLQVVLLVPGTFSVFAFGQELQAHAPGAHGQFSVLPPHLHVVLSVPGC